MIQGIYLCAGQAFHPGHNLEYQDIDDTRDIGGSCLDTDIDWYHYLIATPPCNYWSRMRGSTISQYAIETRDLLPLLLNKFISSGKPFIIENVQNRKRFIEYGLYSYPCRIIEIGRHTYWTNVNFSIDDIVQRQDFTKGRKVIIYDDMTSEYHQGGFNVHQVIERFIITVEKSLGELFI